MKTLLIGPATDVAMDVPDMNLVYAATITAARAIDQHILPYPKDRFLEHKADVVGISVRPYTVSEVVRVTAIYKKKYPACVMKTISSCIDVECCYPFVQFGEVMNVPGEFSDDLPFPDYSLLDSVNYLSANWSSGMWEYPIMTSLGCPYGCEFCAARARSWKKRSAANCAEELRLAVRKYSIRSFKIMDDCFNFDKQRVLDFCRLIRPLKLSWSCANGLRANKFDEELASAMRAAGCNKVGFGVESLDDEVLAINKKGETSDDIKKAVTTALANFEKVFGFVIIGLPGSTYEKDLMTIKWLRDSGATVFPSLYVPPESVAEGGVFYGTASCARGRAYPQEKQAEIYARLRSFKRREYIFDGTLFRLFYTTLKAAPLYDINSWHTHLRVGARCLLKILGKGEVQ